jgi:putative endonuclease
MRRAAVTSACFSQTGKLLHRRQRRPTRAARQAAEGRGRLAEWIAVARLWFSGHRILARRWRVAAGEIDIIALKGQRLAFVEVKYRATTGDAALSVGRRQMARLHAAAGAFVARHPRFAAHERGFDAIFLDAGLVPVYARDHLQPTISRL